MYRIGIIDLDTSHSPYYTACLNRLADFKVTAVFEGGDVRPPGFLENFVQEHGITQVCASVDEMVEVVDAAMVLGQNWDRHLERARPFIEAGKPVYIDKPIVGRLRDVEELAALAEGGAPIMGGSSMRYAQPLLDLRARRHELGPILSAYASGPGDFLNYGCHIAEMVAGFFGRGAGAVSYIGGQGSDLLLLEQRHGPPVVMQFCGGINHHDNHLFLAITTQRGVQAIQPAAGWDVSAALIQRFAEFVRTGQPTTPLTDSLETIKVCLAAAEAKVRGGRVRLDEIPASAGFDGYAYTADYAAGGGYEGTGLATARARYSS